MVHIRKIKKNKDLICVVIRRTFSEARMSFFRSRKNLIKIRNRIMKSIVTKKKREILKEKL